MQLLGILGGAFDPIHFGHLRMAQELADALSLAEVRFIPTASPPHRPQSSTPAADRLAMVDLAIDGNPLFRGDDLEIRRHAEQRQPSYTIDTLLSLEQELGKDTALCLLMGGDAFLGLPAWHRWETLLQHCHIVVANRPNAVLQPAKLSQPLKALWEKSGTHNVRDIAKEKAGRIFMQPITALDISATRIRKDLKLGKSPRYLLPDAVIDYISTHTLYR
ncbi:MAG TPA: nicotinate-nucleotide adenylyltransferase [Methylophilaceae bacterium]|nr:nicotinate-nucleotide adenylyltransferase [Methylophilaceae bacterium]